MQAQLPQLLIKMENNPTTALSTHRPSAAAGSETQLPCMEQEMQSTQTHVKQEPFEVRLVKLGVHTIKNTPPSVAKN